MWGRTTDNDLARRNPDGTWTVTPSPPGTFGAWTNAFTVFDNDNVAMAWVYTNPLEDAAEIVEAHWDGLDWTVSTDLLSNAAYAPDGRRVLAVDAGLEISEQDGTVTLVPSELGPYPSMDIREDGTYVVVSSNTIATGPLPGT